MTSPEIFEQLINQGAIDQLDLNTNPDSPFNIIFRAAVSLAKEGETGPLKLIMERKIQRQLSRLSETDEKHTTVDDKFSQLFNEATQILADNEARSVYFFILGQAFQKNNQLITEAYKAYENVPKGTQYYYNACFQLGMHCLGLGNKHKQQHTSSQDEGLDEGEGINMYMQKAMECFLKVDENCKHNISANNMIRQIAHQICFGQDGLSTIQDERLDNLSGTLETVLRIIRLVKENHALSEENAKLRGQLTGQKRDPLDDVPDSNARSAKKRRFNTYTESVSSSSQATRQVELTSGAKRTYQQVPQAVTVSKKRRLNTSSSVAADAAEIADGQDSASGSDTKHRRDDDESLEQPLKKQRHSSQSQINPSSASGSATAVERKNASAAAATQCYRMFFPTSSSSSTYSNPESVAVVNSGEASLSRNEMDENGNDMVTSDSGQSSGSSLSQPLHKC